MKYGIYYAYWEQEWAANYIPYIEKVAKLGFDFLEIACTPINGYSKQQLHDIRQAARDNGIFLTAGHGPSASQNLASADPAVAGAGAGREGRPGAGAGGKRGYLPPPARSCGKRALSL